MYKFPTAFITNYHKFNGLKQYKVIPLQFYSSEIWSEHYEAEVKMSQS